MKFFSKKEDKFLQDNYLIIPTKRMSKMLGRSEGTARQRMKILGLVVPPEIIQKFKDASRFPKGHISFNKGKKQAEYMSSLAIKKTKATRFKKGGISHNKKPLGSMRVTKDGYMEIKIAEPNIWEAYHRVMWEETFGEIPKGGVVRFVTNDKMNVHPFNLELIDREKNMQLNSVHNLPKPIALAVQLRGALNRQINKHLKKLSA